MNDQHGHNDKAAKDQQQTSIRTISIESDPDGAGGFCVSDEGFVDAKNSQIDFQVSAWQSIDYENDPKWHFRCSFREKLDREKVFIFIQAVEVILSKCADDLLDLFFNTHVQF